MPTILTTKAIEKSTFVIPVSFTDDDGNAVTPKSGLSWTLTDDAGSVINGREGVTITPDTTIYIVLHGDDLTVAHPNNVKRIVTVQGTYDSPSHGNDLELVDWVKFEIDNSVYVT